MKILNIIVFYENSREVTNYISEVSSIADDLVDIVLIINSDTQSQVDNMGAELRENGVDCFRTIDYKENVGYLNSMLKTIKQIDVELYDYVILSNTDIHYDSEEFFYRLAQNKYSEDIGCIAPCVYATKSRSYSNPHYRERISKAKLQRLEKIFRYPLFGKLYLRISELKARRVRTKKLSSCFVYSPHGCYMIFTKEFIKRIYGYEYGAKMYSEESAVGELLIKNGLRCYYDDSISVTHQESSVTGKIDYKKRFRAWHESIKYILDEFY